MVSMYSSWFTMATRAPTLRSNSTSPSASRRRTASRTGTTLMPSSLAMAPSTSR